MVKLLKISIVISMSTWFILLSGCEKQSETKEQKMAPMIVSGTILPPSSGKIEKTPTPPPESTGQPLTNQAPPPPTTEAKEKVLNSSGAVTEEVAKKEQMAVPVTPGNSDAMEMAVGYDPQGRVDPFIPLLQEKEVPNPDIEEEPKRMLTPLEKMSLSQIKLVAVILMKNREIAMVEDATGKGYEVKIGTYMGQNSGQVSEINQSSIIVKEFLKDYKGKRQANFQELKLHKQESGE